VAFRWQSGGVFCVTTGAVLEVAMAAFTTSEWKLARQLYATLQPDDVVVADSAYGTYVDLALVRSVNADGVFRKHHARHCDFRRGKKLGIGDHIVQWQRPQCPQSMSAADFAALPASIEVRSAFIAPTRVSSQGNHFGHHLSRLKRYSQARLAQLYQLGGKPLKSISSISKQP